LILAGKTPFFRKNLLSDGAPAVGDLLDAEVRGPQQKGGLHQEHLVDVVDDGAAFSSI